MNDLTCADAAQRGHGTHETEFLHPGIQGCVDHVGGAFHINLEKFLRIAR